VVAVAQLVESRIVIPVVVGSSPISHPKRLSNINHLRRFRDFAWRNSERMLEFQNEPAHSRGLFYVLVLDFAMRFTRRSLKLTAGFDAFFVFELEFQLCGVGRQSHSFMVRLSQSYGMVRHERPRKSRSIYYCNRSPQGGPVPLKT
jgi:hypothetical protein